MRILINILSVILGFVIFYKWRNRFMTIGLYIPFVRRFVVAREFEKFNAMAD